ncbi:(4Fe-4S)-binding protein [Rhodococcus sp. WB1]|uniref:ferredoxin n=1 Tax=Rhodococcus TaxID=1827 RepID=UPI00045D38E2|nr:MULTISPECIES: ferredoxin [Rhodococcus]ANZ25894.1 (4Fe-4S)-binding protein [Rhodococcus sp. WB1]KDE14432.1 (4Fe-4S)-binding protein [Rhodococcus aetherivorans]MDV6292398.1 4Fe-4S binding protein [Rhodococcus aetherivorans]PND52515.1 (4Fe-4S)-binding protein [Rhodococcus sp. ENV425]USC17238.1 4Fe-4S binding protein [Rhodococcus sp. 11-3]
MPYFIGEPCTDVMDKSCMEECPVDAIYEGARKLYIHPFECVDCGACQSVCPMEAISNDRRVDETTRIHLEDNAVFFSSVLPGRDAPLGSPGGAVHTGPIGVDTPLVAARD